MSVQWASDNLGLHAPEAQVQTEPEGISEGSFDSCISRIGIIQLHGGFHQLDEVVTQLVAPPAPQCLQQACTEFVASHSSY